MKPTRQRRRPQARGVGRDLSPRRQSARRGRAGGARRAPTPRPRRAALGVLGSLTRPAARAAILLAELLAVVVLANHPAFAARKIDVNGLKHLNRSQVLRLAGLGPNSRMLLLSTGQLEAAVGHDPYVRSVSARASLPDSVTLDVTEWEAAALLVTPSAHQLLSPAGTVLGPAAETPPPLVVNIDEKPPLPGSRVMPARLLADLEHMRAAFPGAYGLVITAFDLGADQQLTAETDGPRILFGQMATDEQIDSLDPKLASLKALRGRIDLKGSKLDYINLQNPGAPVTHGLPSPLPSPTPTAKPTPGAHPSPTPSVH